MKRNNKNTNKMASPVYPELNVFDLAHEARKVRVALYFIPTLEVKARIFKEQHVILDAVSSRKLLISTFKTYGGNLPASLQSSAEILMADLDSFTSDGSLIHQFPAYLPDPGHFR